MARKDRRERVALNDAYLFFKDVIKGDGKPDLYKLANSLKTISNALKSAENSEFKLTTRLWQRIESALFEKLVSLFPADLRILSKNGRSILPNELVPGQATVEIHPEGLRRSDDLFSIPLANLAWTTQVSLKRAWEKRAVKIRPEDFKPTECEQLCQPSQNFIVGEQVLENESELGKNHAYQKWWQLYWQAYCSSNQYERLAIEKEMSNLETVWGDLYY